MNYALLQEVHDELELQIFRYLAQKLLEIRKYSCVVSIQANEKSGNASCVQSLCGIALRMICRKKLAEMELCYFERTGR